MANPTEILNAGFNSVTGRNYPQRISAGPPAVGQSAKQIAGTISINTGATITINTVTTGKTFYITDIHLATDSTASVDAKIQAAGVTIFETFLINTAPCDMVGIETQPFATSTQAVTLLLPTVAGKNVNYFLSGYEE
ncbi:MAG: hypothetical protein NVS1B10_07320 [Candidatus Saccharimonadales bacterium]